MSGKDCLKLLMIAYGYSHELEVFTYHDDQGLGYCVKGKNAKGEEFYADGCNNILWMMEQIIEGMQNRGAKLRTSFWADMKISDVLNDDWRNKHLQSDYAKMCGI